MAGDQQQVALALQTLTQQVNLIAERMQSLESIKPVSEEQLNARSVELQRLSADAVRGVDNAVAELRMRAADAVGGGRGESRIVLISEKNDPPQHFGGDKGDHLHFRSWSKNITNYLQSRRRGY